MKCGVGSCPEQAQPEHTPCCGNHGGMALCEDHYAIGHDYLGETA